MSDLLGEEMLVDAVAPAEIPQQLAEQAHAEHLTERDVTMLAAINFRGQRPQTLDAWRLV